MKVEDNDWINEIYLKVIIQDLEEEIKNLKLIQETNENQIKNDIKERDELREEIKNLKSDLGQYSEAYKRYRDYEKEELAESCYDLARENKKLKDELEEIKNDLEHRDSILSIMYDLLRSDLGDYEQLCMIDVVIDVEVWNEPQNKLREELLDRFWKRDF